MRKTRWMLSMISMCDGGSPSIGMVFSILTGSIQDREGWSWENVFQKSTHTLKWCNALNLRGRKFATHSIAIAPLIREISKARTHPLSKWVSTRGILNPSAVRMIIMIFVELTENLKSSYLQSCLFATLWLLLQHAVTDRWTCTQKMMPFIISARPRARV